MDTKQIKEQRLWERYAHYLDIHGINKWEAIENAILDVQFFDEELKARLERL